MSAGVLESKFNRFDPQSGVSRMNRSAACGETSVDDELYGALEMCRVFNRSTCGSFDIAVQSEGTSLRRSDICYSLRVMLCDLPEQA